MNRFTAFCLKTVRWSSWPLLFLILSFLVTGYLISGRFGWTMLLDEKQALALHKLLHVPLIALLVVHTLPAVYLAMRRWGWGGRRRGDAETRRHGEEGQIRSEPRL